MRAFVVGANLILAYYFWPDATGGLNKYAINTERARCCGRINRSDRRADLTIESVDRVQFWDPR